MLGPTTSNFLSEQQHREEATGQYQLPVEHQASLVYVCVCVCVYVCALVYLLLLGERGVEGVISDRLSCSWKNGKHPVCQAVIDHYNP